MTLALRLLRGYVGQERPPTAFSLGGVGFWNDISEPRAHYYNGKTYLTWIDDSGKLWAAQYVHSTGLLSTPVNIGTISTAVDGIIHASPSLLVRSSDHKILVLGVPNGSGQPKLWTSTNPEDATAFNAGTAFGASATYTYGSLVQLPGAVNAPIYAFVRHWNAGTGYLAYFKSTDGGSTWSSVQDLIGPVSTTDMYWRVGTDGSTRIDLYVTTTDRASSPASTHHLYMVSDTLYKTDGTSIGAASGGPYAASVGTLVQDASLGSCRPDGWAWNGNPACLILVNPSNAGTDVAARAARWTGSAWQVDAVANAGGVLAGNEYVNAGAMTKDDPNEIWFPVKVGSKFELYRYRSTDGGSTWTATPITSGSSLDNSSPDTPLNADDGLQVVWGLGTFVDATNFDFTVYGAGT